MHIRTLLARSYRLDHMTLAPNSAALTKNVIQNVSTPQASTCSCYTAPPKSLASAMMRPWTGWRATMPIRDGGHTTASARPSSSPRCTGPYMFRESKLWDALSPSIQQRPCARCVSVSGQGSD